MNNLLDYQNRTDPSKRYAKHLFRSAKGIQAAEHNEVQDTAHLRLKSVADTMHSDGDRVEGCEIAVNAATGLITAGAGKVYINAEVHSVAAANFPVPANGTFAAGIWYTERIVTEIEDGTLRDPAVGTANYQQPGAARLQIATFWGLSNESRPDGQFYGLYSIVNREVAREKQPEPIISQVSEALARYDRDSNGSFVIEGFTVRVLAGAPANKQVFSISEGGAHVMGYEAFRSYAQRLVVDENASIREVEDEQHIFSPNGSGKMRIDVRHVPIEMISMIKLTRQRTVTITHGAFSGAMDPLPDESVVIIVSVAQSGKTYVQGTDYTLQNDGINWAPLGDEPSPGSTYTVTYQYRLIVQPESPDTHGFTVSNSVTGQLVQVRYSYRLPRVDILVIDKNGDAQLVMGVPHSNSPTPPSAPPETLRIATIIQRWEGLPEVVNDSVRVTSMREIELMRKSIIDLYDLTAQNKMASNAIINAPASVRGLFVDPLTNDNMRDQGIAQGAAIVAGELMLPLDAAVAQIVGNIINTLNYTVETIFDQPARTGSMKVNPYNAQDPLPARVTLDPAIDRWNIEETQWTSDITRAITQVSGGYFVTYTTTGQVVETLGASSAADVNLRVRSVGIHVEGFGANEGYTVTFDGVTVKTGTANSNGVIDATFTIPSGLPAGTKQVVVTGSGGSRGDTVYIGTGTVTTTAQRNIVTVTTHVDPLAQTFMLNATRHVSGAEIFVTKKGTSEIRAQIRDVQFGLPGRSVFAEGRIAASAIKEGMYNRVTFEQPALLLAGTDYALVVLTDMSNHEVAVAELGKWDIASGSWLTRQAYQLGVLLSSSNAHTWADHQTMDLCFRLLGAKFVSSVKTVTLGTVTLSDVTDLLPLAEIEYASAASEATFVLKQGSTEVARIQPGRTISMTAKLSGTYTLLVELTGETNLSPVLYSGVQLVQGKLRHTADYVSRAFICGANKRILVTMETMRPGSSTVQVYVQTGANAANSNAWTEATQTGVTEMGDGWRERVFTCDCSLSETRIKIILTGSPSGRPRARSLRAVVLDD
jgi:hypothetical protein